MRKCCFGKSQLTQPISFCYCDTEESKLEIKVNIKNFKYIKNISSISVCFCMMILLGYVKYSGKKRNTRTTQYRLNPDRLFTTYILLGKIS